MLIRDDLTGRKFVCLGKEEKNCYGWASSFTPGLLYYECESKMFPDAEILSYKGLLYLFDDFGDLKFVDQKEFTEVDLESKNFRILIKDAMFSWN